jgi:hypothetical protein
VKSRLSPFRRLSSRISSWQEELSRSSATLDEKGLQAELSQAIKTLQIKVHRKANIVINYLASVPIKNIAVL